ncbi:MAG: MFS transporter [Clostridia bacterium]|nr:MFS transporter [Clostridia bacterium]
MREKQVAKFGYTSAEYRKFRKYAVRYLLLFSLLYCCLYCMRLNLSGAGPEIMRSLSWSSKEFGILTGTLFWTYGIGQLLSGRLSEIAGTTRFVILSVLLSAAVNIIMGFQSALWVMVILWGLNGFFQSMAWTPGLAALTNWWPGNTRGFATGFAHAFSGFGQAAATLAVTLSFAVLPSQGWRAALWIPVAFPLAMLVLFVLFARATPASVGLPEYTENDPQRVEHERNLRDASEGRGMLYPFRYLLSNGRFWLWIVIGMITGIARYGLSTWIPLYFVEKFDMDITSGLLRSLTLPVGMGIGTLVVPALTDKFCPTNRLPAVIVSAIVGALSVAGIMALDPRMTAQRVLLLELLFIAGFCIYAISGTSWAYATDIGGRVFSGTCSGILDFSAYFGAALQSMLYGLLIRSFGWKMVFVSIAVLCACVAVLGTIGSKSKKA